MAKEKAKETTAKAISLKTLTKSTVWDVQENDIFRMLEAGDKDSELKDNLRHYADIIRSAFMIEDITREPQPVRTESSMAQISSPAVIRFMLLTSFLFASESQRFPDNDDLHVAGDRRLLPEDQKGPADALRYGDQVLAHRGAEPLQIGRAHV